MSFNPVLAVGPLRFYESRDHLNGGQQSLARAVENITDGKVRAVYQFPMIVDPQGYSRFRLLAQYADSRFGTQIPAAPQQFQEAYRANQRWEAWDKKVVFGLNNSDRKNLVSEKIVDRFLEYDSSPVTVIPQVMCALGVSAIARERRQTLEQEFRADGLVVARRIRESVNAWCATRRAREGLTQLSADAFLDLTEHEPGFVARGNAIDDLAAAQRIENDLVALYNSF